MKSIITVVGKDKVGIIAKVSGFLMTHGVNIEDISQTLLQDYFVMLMMADIKNSNANMKELSAGLDKLGEEIGVSIRIQREEIFNAMHKV